MDNNSASPNGLIVTGIVLIIIGIIGLANLANETRGTVIIGLFVLPMYLFVVEALWTFTFLYQEIILAINFNTISVHFALDRCKATTQVSTVLLREFSF